MNKIQQFLYKILWTQLQSLGFFEEGKFVYSSKLHPQYNKWLDETLEMFVRNHYLEKKEGIYFVVKPEFWNLDFLWEQWEKEKILWFKEEQRGEEFLTARSLKPLLRLIEVALKSLPDILMGKISATDILFPRSSMELVEGVYKDNEIADYFNDVLANALVIYIQERIKADNRAQIKILEIGAGVGGTSAKIFQKIRPYKEHIREYCYTDISKAFLLHAEKEYGSANPYLTYQIFNVEMPIAEQGIEAGGYDVVIAANVLHATKNIRTTLRHTKAVLKTRGLLFLNEINGYNLFSHLTFGLLEGWWRYEDPKLRTPGCPGLSPRMWQSVLENEGFSSICASEKGSRTEQQIIIAQSDGVVRQKIASPVKQLTPLFESKSHSSFFDLSHQTLDSPIFSCKEKMNRSFENAVDFIKQVLSKTVKLDYGKIETHTAFEKYGIDSILQVNFIKELEKFSGELPKTILFEYDNIDELAKYLVKKAPDIYQTHPECKNLEKGKNISDKEADSAAKPVDMSALKFRPLLNFNPTAIEWNLPSPEIADPIAIIGMSGRYPLSHSLRELWINLEKGRNCLTEVPLSRQQTSLDRLNTKVPEKFEKIYGGFLDQIDCFDYELFEMNLQQILELPPEVRLFLEIAWETCEDGGYTQNMLSDFQKDNQLGIGVFVGNMYNQYFWNIPSLEHAQLSSNGTDWNIANRVSHFFDFTGPSIALNTACSSSLHAIHLACESLKQQNCSMAIAGGINLTLNLAKYKLLKKANLLGTGDKSKSFGIGDGLIPGEGVGAVLLKPFTKAIKDGDRIHAVIRGSFVNHSGGRQMYAAPDPQQQAKLILHSIKKACIDPATIGYIESAANGSKLGDSIEVIALNKAFGHLIEKKQSIPLGSIKSNVGHLEAASGISQLHKVILQLKNKVLVPTIHAEPINPNIKLENTPFYLQKIKQEWDLNEKNSPRRSMINSFGAGGSYANLIVEEYVHRSKELTLQRHGLSLEPLTHFSTAPNLASAEPSMDQKSIATVEELESLLLFSAKTEWSLLKYIEKIEIFILENPFITLDAIAWSLQKINHGLKYRVAIIAKSREEALKKIAYFREIKQSSSEFRIFTSLDCKGPKLSSSNEEIDPLFDQADLRHLAEYWTAGRSVDFRKLIVGPFRGCDLPTYAFDHRYKFGFEKEHFDYCSNSAIEPYRRGDNYQEFDSETYAFDHPYLRDHQVEGRQILVGAVYPSLMIRAFFKIFPLAQNVSVEKINYLTVIEVKKNQKVEVRTLPIEREDGFELKILHRFAPSDNWRITAEGQIKKTPFQGKKIDLLQLQNSLEKFPDLDLLYNHSPAVIWGNTFKRISALFIKGQSILAKVELNEDLRDNFLSPILTNSVYLSVCCLINNENVKHSFIPFGIQEVSMKKIGIQGVCWLSIQLVKKSEELFVFDIDVFDESGELLVYYKGYSLKRNRTGDREKSKSVSFPVSVETFPVTDDIYEKTQKYLCEKIDKFLNNNSNVYDQIESNLMELGLDSQQLVNIIREIGDDFNIDLELTLFFEYPNIKDLTQFLLQEYKNACVYRFKTASKVEASNALYLSHNAAQEDTHVLKS